MRNKKNPLIEEFDNFCAGDDAYWMYEFDGATVLIQNPTALRAIAKEYGVTDRDLQQNAVWLTNYESDWLDFIKTAPCVLRLERVMEGTLSDNNDQILIAGDTADDVRKVSKALFEFYDNLGNISMYDLPENLYEEAMMIRRGKMLVNCSIDDKTLVASRDVSGCYCNHRYDVVNAIISAIEFKNRPQENEA